MFYLVSFHVEKTLNPNFEQEGMAHSLQPLTSLLRPILGVVRRNPK